MYIYIYISMMTLLCNRIDFHLIVVISCNFNLRIVAMLIPVRWKNSNRGLPTPWRIIYRRGICPCLCVYIYIYTYKYILCVQYQIFIIYIYTYHVCIYTYIYEYIYIYIYITVFVPNSASMICPPWQVDSSRVLIVRKINRRLAEPWWRGVRMGDPSRHHRFQDWSGVRMLRGSHFGKPPNKRSRRSGGLLSGKKKGVKLSVLALIRGSRW